VNRAVVVSIGEVIKVREFEHIEAGCQRDIIITTGHTYRVFA
jgi:hypothetical protein